MNKHLYQLLPPLGRKVVFQTIDPQTDNSPFATSICCSSSSKVIRCVIYFCADNMYSSSSYSQLQDIFSSIRGPFIVRYLPNRIEIHYIE